MQSTGDHASYNEGLSNRAAASNLLNLVLEHLNIQVVGGGEARNEVDRVVRARGPFLFLGFG